jgi:hypothetical protein
VKTAASPWLPASRDNPAPYLPDMFASLFLGVDPGVTPVPDQR